ncbi:MAG: septum formation initiator family protein [Proteobacteria bacterium]|nr:septum formation initiator family protein [Pseudomonadota bacterium]
MAKRRQNVWDLVKRAAGPAAALLVIAFFGGYALAGPNGIMAWGDYKRQLDQRQVELDKLEAKKKVIANRVALLDPKKANPDLADELIRERLGYAHPDEIIIPMDDAK